MIITFHRKFFTRALICCTKIVITQLVCFAQVQDINISTRKDQESFFNITDQVIKKEIGSFNIKGGSLSKLDTSSKINLTKIPLYLSTELEANFSDFGVLKGSMSVRISASSFGTVGDLHKKIDSIFVVTHSHFWVKFPDSAYAGINDPNFSFYDNKNKGQKNWEASLTSQYCKVFQSEDKRRIYIYMLNSSGAAKYEATWIIKDDKYYARVLDYNL